MALRRVLPRGLRAPQLLRAGAGVRGSFSFGDDADTFFKRSEAERNQADASFAFGNAESSGGVKVVANAVVPKRVIPTIHDPQKVVRPGHLADIGTVVRNWWSFPAVGFNSILEIPVQQLEVLDTPAPKEVGAAVVPNSIFGLPLRKDMVYKVYWYHRKALAGYDPAMQLHKWEWPGSNKKMRSQKSAGKGRIGRRKGHGWFEGSFSNALRPKDYRMAMPKKVIWRALRVMLSAKYAQDSIKVVDSFNLQSHKTKYLVQHLRRIVGRKCHSALLVHEGNLDVNDNFRWASAHIAAVNRENVEGLSVYKLLKYHQIIFTEAALTKLIATIQGYPKKRGWGQQFATPDGLPAPIPQKVDGWNDNWVERKLRLRDAEFRGREFFREQAKWKWSHELKGPLKIPRTDPLMGFRVRDFLRTPEKPLWEKLESLYADDEPLEEVPEDPEWEGLMETMEASHVKGLGVNSEFIDKREVQTRTLGQLEGTGKSKKQEEADDADDDSSRFRGPRKP